MLFHHQIISKNNHFLCTFLLLNIKEVIIINNITMGDTVCMTKTSINSVVNRAPWRRTAKTRSDNNELYHYVKKQGCLKRHVVFFKKTINIGTCITTGWINNYLIISIDSKLIRISVNWSSRSSMPFYHLNGVFFLNL